MKKIMVVFGTRAESIKLCPLIKELKSRPKMQTVICVTAQHREMLDAVLKAFSIQPNYDLNVMKDRQTLFDTTTNVLEGIKRVLEKEKPDIVLVHGDTNTSFATALACYYLHIPVGHVEAGLRSYNLQIPFPEEFNRKTISIISWYDFAPTKHNYENLIKEGKDPSFVWVTGNTACDALCTTVCNSYSHPELDWCKDSRLILITAHRRESLGAPMKQMFRAVKRVLDEHEDVKAIYPIHMNPEVRDMAESVFNGNVRIHLIEPLDVLDFHNFMRQSYLILTDSGGVQDEAPSLGKPVLVMRDATERPEGIEAGVQKLVGTNEETVYTEFTKVLESRTAYEEMSRVCHPFGDGHASERIADILEFGKIQPEHEFEAYL